MSGIVRGLAGLEKYVERNSGGGEQGEKARWLRLDDGQVVRINFLQELDQDSPNFNDKAGAAFLAVEHSNPDNYRRKALCTIEEEGACYGCEQDRVKPKKGWRSRGRLYVNVLVDDGKEEPYVAILSQGTSGKTITPSLLMWAGENESITDSAFRIKRSGTGTATEYSLVPAPKSSGANPDEYSLYDIEKIATRYIPYAEQEQFYSGGVEDSGSTSSVSTSSSAMEW